MPQVARRSIGNRAFRDALNARLESDRREWWIARTGVRFLVIRGEMHVDPQSYDTLVSDQYLAACRELTARSEPPFWLALWRLITRRA